MPFLPRCGRMECRHDLRHEGGGTVTRGDNCETGSPFAWDPDSRKHADTGFKKLLGQKAGCSQTSCFIPRNRTVTCRIGRLNTV